MGQHHCHESPDGWHEVCKRFVATAKPEVWENLAPHMLLCLAAAGILSSGICAWRLHTRRDRNDREQADCEWHAGKNIVVIPATFVKPVLALDLADDCCSLDNFSILKHSKNEPYKDDKVSMTEFLNSGQ